MPPRRRRRIIRLGAIVLSVLAIVLFFPQAFNLPTGGASIETTWLLFILQALSFLAILVLAIVLARQILKLYSERKANVLGAQFKTKLVAGALGLSLLPVVCMFTFTYGLINRTLDKWFSRPVEAVRDDTRELSDLLAQYVQRNAASEADSLAASPEIHRALSAGHVWRLPSVLSDHDAAWTAALEGGFALIADANGHIIGSLQAPRDWENISQLPPLRRVRVSGGIAGLVTIGEQSYALADRAVTDTEIPAHVYVGMPVPPPLTAKMANLSSEYLNYQRLSLERHSLRRIYTGYLLLLTLAVLFAATWFALFLSKLITVPMQALARATQEISRGNLSHRVEISGKDELGALIASFNRMAAELETTRAQIEASRQQLQHANTELDHRRRYTERLLESIPSAVISLAPDGRIARINPAVHRLFGKAAESAEHLEDLFEPEAMQQFEHLWRRADRLGVVAGQLELALPAGADNDEGASDSRETGAAVEACEGGSIEARESGSIQAREGGASEARRNLTVAATLSQVPVARSDGSSHAGYVLVLEDLTDLLRAQQMSAWREVAQRIAHEIKNPLTPIALSAERIRLRVERVAGERKGAGVETVPNGEAGPARAASAAVHTKATNATPQRGAAPPATSSTLEVIAECAATIEGEVHSLQRLVDEFSAFARFPAAQPVSSDLNAIVEAALRVFEGRLVDIEIKTDLQRLPPLQLDPERMKRVFVNLIDNAAEAMRQSPYREIAIYTSAGESSVEAVVADTGSGIRPADKEHLFLPYFSTKRRGTGLGLTVVRSIVEEHGGTIRVEENHPVGTRFIVELPLA